MSKPDEFPDAPDVDTTRVEMTSDDTEEKMDGLHKENILLAIVTSAMVSVTLVGYDENLFVGALLLTVAYTYLTMAANRLGDN